MPALRRSALGPKTPANHGCRHRHGALLALLFAAASGGFVAIAQASTTITEFHVTESAMDLGLGSGLDFSLDGKGPLGQSFTVPTGHDWDHITFNFYSRDTGEAAATGHLYLFNAPHGGFDALNDKTPGLLGIGSATGDVYAFDASLRLHADTKYFVYADAPVAGAAGILWTGYLEGARYAGGDFFVGRPVMSYDSLGSVLLTNAYFASSQSDAAFKVAGVSAVPEPDALSLLFSGLGALGCIALIPRKTR